MDDILRQLDVLFIGSVPTVLLFLVLWFCYTTILHNPLRRTLALRRERTAGAVERAQAAMAMAEVKAQEYEARLRAARREMQAERERQVAGWNAARDAALAAAREAAGVRVRNARAAIARQAADSRVQIEAAADSLAEQVIAVVLPSGQVQR